MKKEAFKEESSRTRTDKHFQEAFDHFKPKEVFNLKDDPETIDLSEPDDLSPIATAVREKERKQMIRVFGAYQHFLFILLLFASLQATGQRNTLWLTHNPTDMALGLRYDRQISNLGLYTGVSYGNYRIDDVQRIDDHIKLSAGAIRYVPDTMNRTTLLYSIGLSYHHYGNTQYFDDINRKVLFPLSVDMGVGARIKWFNVGFTMDFIKWEGGFIFGVTF